MAIMRLFAGVALVLFVILVNPAFAQKPDVKPDVKAADKTATAVVAPEHGNSEKAPANPVPADTPATIAPLVPPAPLTIKLGESTVAIPVDALRSVGKYVDEPVAMTNVTVGSSFGYRRDPFTRRAKFHSGLDIKAKAGDPIAASHPGVVKFAGWFSGYGNWVVIDHGGGITTHYAHLSGFAVDAGQKVTRGTLIGYAGRTGRATSPHLHYEVRVNGTPVNPLEAIPLESESDYFKAPSSTELAPATSSSNESAKPKSEAPSGRPAADEPARIEKPTKTNVPAAKPSQQSNRPVARCVI